jgi:class 3 adenylate cyclase/ribonuclease BN (tRNA processing enzyme)
VPLPIQFDVWGSRGSRSLVPARSEIANHTSCYSLSDGEELFVFDAGRGLAALGHAVAHDACFQGVRRVHICVTHAHMDHWEGLKDADWFWRRNNGLVVRILGCTEALDALRTGHAHPGYVPLDLLAKGTVASLEYVALAAGQPATVGRWTLRTAPLNHYSGEADNPSVLNTLGFRLEEPSGPVLAYLSDHEPTASTRALELEMLAGARLVVYDSQFADLSQQTHGHGSQEHAAAMARLHPGALVLAGHLGAGRSDAEVREAQQRHAAGLSNFDLAVEGARYLWSAEAQAFLRTEAPGAATSSEGAGLDAAARKKARHDLRTPINQIIGYAELLAEQAQEEGRAGDVDDLQKIGAAARRQLELIGELFADTPVEPVVAAPEPAPQASSAQAGAAADEEDLSRTVVVQAAEPAFGQLLVVDDNPANRDMLSRRLAARGFTVSTAENGQQALDMVEAQDFDLVLLDVMMPGISGIDVLKTVRATRSSSDLPVIMATARDASEDIVTALALGANDYVTKPLDFPVVMARVQAQLVLKRQKEQIARLAKDLEVRNRFIRNTFGRYLSDEVVEGLLESPEGLKLGGESRRVTILMSDLRGFTQVSERLGPEQVVRMLNMYLGVMADIILKYQGTIDEFIGDAILALFGAPVTRADDARRAVACALDMQRAMDDVNARLAAESLPRIEMGVAIHSGDVVVGNIGSQRRTKYGIVGPPVNLTGRIESYTVGGQILVSEATLRETGPILKLGEEIQIRAKGAAEPVVVYDLLGIGGEYGITLSHRDDPLRPLAQELPVRFWLLEGKRVGDDSFEAAFIRLSSSGGELRCTQTVRPLSNLQIRFQPAEGSTVSGVSGDLYAKVLDSGHTDSGRFVVRFTAVPPGVEEFLRQTLQAS